MKQFFIVILTFFFIYNVPFNFLPFGTGKFFAFFGLCLVIIQLIKKKVTFLKNKNVIGLIIFILLLLGYSLINSSFIHQTFEFSIPYAFFLFLFEHLIGCVVILFFLKKFKMATLDDMLRILIYTISLQSFLMLLMLIIPSFKTFGFSILEGTQLSLSERYGGFRGVGFASSVTYDLSVIQSIGLMLISVYLLRVKSKSLFYFITFLWCINIIAVLVSGRTGWLGIAFSLLIFFINFLYSRKSFKSQNMFLVSLIMISTICLILYQLLASAELREMVQLKILPYAFEIFINASQSGQLETESSNILKSMYFSIPIQSLIIGDGYYLSPNGQEYYMHTDAGYMRQVLYYGLIGSLLLYSMYIYIFIKLLRKTYLNYPFPYFFLTLSLFAYYFIAHIKGDFLVGSNMNIKLLFLIFVLLSQPFGTKTDKLTNE